MPRDFGKIRHGFWSGTGETRRALRALPIEVQTVAAYLMSCGSSNMIGLYYLPIPLIVHEIGSGLTLEGASGALQSLSEVGFAHYDATQEIVFVPNMAREQIAERLKPNDAQIKGVLAQLEQYRKSRFVSAFLDIYRDAFHLRGFTPSTAPVGPLEAPSKPESREQRAEAENRERGLPEDGGQGTTKQVAAHDWLTYFQARYWSAKGRQYGRGESDARALGSLSELLDSFPAEQRTADWQRRESIVEAFLASTDPRTVRAGWSFPFFVAAFRGLVLGPGTKGQPVAVRTEDVYQDLTKPAGR